MMSLKTKFLPNFFQLQNKMGTKKVTKEQQQLTETSTGMSSNSLAIAFRKVSFLCWKASMVFWSA